MRLHAVAPALSLSTHVSKIFAMEGAMLLADGGFPLVANGYPALLYQHSPSAVIAGNRQKIATLNLCGQIISPIHWHSDGPLTIIAYFFYPDVFHQLFNIDANACTDKTFDLTLLDPFEGRRLSEQMANAASVTNRFDILNGYIVKRISASRNNRSKPLQKSAQAIRLSNGLVSLTNIRDHCGMSERTFRRAFDTQLGISPKMFSRVCQFDAAFQSLNTGKFDQLGNLSHDFGYADQSHFIRTFKEFTSLSPSRYQQQINKFHQLNS